MIKDLGIVQYFLDIEIIPFQGDIFLSQVKYAKEILEKVAMYTTNTVSTLLPVKHILHLNTNS